jgi:hypothetical protein
MAVITGVVAVNMRLIKLIKQRWAGHAARIMGGMKTVCKIVIGKAEANDSLEDVGLSMYKRIILKEILYECDY